MMSSAIAGQPKHRQAHKLKRQPRLSNSQYPPQIHTRRDIGREYRAHREVIYWPRPLILVLTVLQSLIRTLFVGQGYRRHSTKFETCSSQVQRHLNQTPISVSFDKKKRCRVNNRLEFHYYRSKLLYLDININTRKPHPQDVEHRFPWAGHRRG